MEVSSVEKYTTVSDPTPAEANCFDNNSFPEPELPPIKIELPSTTPLPSINASSKRSIPVETIFCAIIIHLTCYLIISLMQILILRLFALLQSLTYCKFL